MHPDSADTSTGLRIREVDSDSLEKAICSEISDIWSDKIEIKFNPNSHDHSWTNLRKHNRSNQSAEMRGEKAGDGNLWASGELFQGFAKGQVCGLFQKKVLQCQNSSEKLKA